MQNISNYSNIPSEGRSTALSLQHYQRYITEMTAYINQNNHKYTKNMTTLKQYYEQQIAALQYQRDELLAASSRLQNQKLTLKDLLANANLQNGQLQDRLAEAEQNIGLGRQKLQRQRKLIDSIYEEMNHVRNSCNLEIQNYSKKTQICQQEAQQLKLQLSQKVASLKALQEKMADLQQNLRDRYLQPQKVRNAQRQSDKIKIQYEQIRKKCLWLQQRQEQLQLELSKYRKQNESLKILKGNFSAQKQQQVQKVEKQQKEQADHRTNKLELQNQNLIYQINQSQSRIKKMASEIAALEVELQKRREVIDGLQLKLSTHQSHKDNYVGQFALLKNEYQGVIQRLQDSLIDYQKKNWNLQQQNNDLNSQLQSLQELLQEMKAMNSLNPMKKEYRRMAELQLLSRQNYNREKDTQKSKQEQQKRMFPEMAKQEKSDYEDEWAKLLGDIQKIKV